MVPAPRFLFRGEAVGVAGHIRRPVDFVIPAQASVSLPIIGGRGFRAIDGGSFGGAVSFGSAVVTVYGDYVPPGKAVKFTRGNHKLNDLPTLTRVSTEVHDLRIVSTNGRSRGHTLTVARLATTMESRHPRHHVAEPSFKTRLEIEGFAIDGECIEVEFADELLEVETYQALHEPPADGGVKAPSPRTRFADLFEKVVGGGTRGKAQVSPPSFEVCTACLEIRPPRNSPAKVDGPNVLHVRDFGTIYFAEMVLSPVDRRLAMMRIELGSPLGGDVLIGGSGIDGHDWPP